MFENLFSMDGKYARTMNWLWNVIVLSLLWLLCCIPIVTIGASSTAGYYAAAKVIHHKTGSIASEFFSSFRSNLKQSLPLTIVFLLIFAIILGECVLLYFDDSFPLVLVYLFYLLAFAVYAFSIYLWACLSRFTKTTFSYFSMAMILVFRHLLTTFLLLLLHGAVFLMIFLMPWGFVIFPGLCLYLETFLMEKILLRYSPKISEKDPESQLWFYQ